MRTTLMNPPTLRSITGLALAAICVAAGPAPADEAVLRAKGELALGIHAADARHEKAIRAQYAAFAKAFNAHDTDAMAELWTEDGDLLEPDGTHARGRDQVRRLFEREHATAFQAAKIQLEVDAVHFLAEGVALVDGSYTLNFVQTTKGQMLPTRAGRLTGVLVLRDGEWKVAASRAMLVVPLVWRPS